VSDAPDHVERNRAELERMRAIVAKLDDAGLNRPVNESWTLSGVLGHIAFWDGRALFLAEKLSAGEPYTPSDQEPEDVDWINDATRPLITPLARMYPDVRCARRMPRPQTRSQPRETATGGLSRGPPRIDDAKGDRRHEPIVIL
jgi:hypothetical protein